MAIRASVRVFRALSQTSVKLFYQTNGAFHEKNFHLKNLKIPHRQFIILKSDRLSLRHSLYSITYLVIAT